MKGFVKSWGGILLFFFFFNITPLNRPGEDILGIVSLDGRDELEDELEKIGIKA